MIKKTSSLILVACLFFSIFSTALVRKSDAVIASDWIAGNIIDDSIFVNKDSMSVSQIQTFLNNKVGTGTNGVQGQCDTDGIRTSELGGGTRAQYGASHNNPAPFTCLKDYYEVPKTTLGPGIPANNYGGKAVPSGAKSAAQLIWDAAQQYDISPKVLLVKLGTESTGPLTSDDWPFLRQYTYAMGSHCPDSGPGGSANCDSDYAGFSIQISSAASLLRYYLDNMDQAWWPYKKPYQVNSIYWNIVESGCGASNVLIGDKATAALYTYTPYQPNQAALNNMYGSGDGCSAYGNRNFWRTFSDWFGTVRDYVSLVSPRFMVLGADTYKKDPVTGDNIDGLLTKGTQLKFTSKLLVNGMWYLRTAYDSSYSLSKGIRYSDIVEIPYEAFDNPRFMKITSYTHKRRPSSEEIDMNQPFDVGSQIKISNKILINGQWYYRTEYDTIYNNDLALPASSLGEIQYESFQEPRYMVINGSTNKINPVTGTSDTSLITKDSQLFFNSKIYVKDRWYYRTDTDTSSNAQLGVDSSFVDDIQFIPYDAHPKWLQLKIDSKKVSTLTTIAIPGPNSFSNGSQLFIIDKIFINGQWYYRTKYDATYGNKAAIASDNFEEIPFVPMETPRPMRLRLNLQKVDPKTGEKVDGILPKDMSIDFSTKIFINGVLYLRTKYDTDNNFDTSIRFQDLY